MAKDKLNALTVKGIKKAGTYSDGNGLYLRVGNGRRSWLFRYKRNKTPHWMGLGRVEDVSLSEARELARHWRKALTGGLDPIDTRQAQRAAAIERPFETVAELCIDSHRSGWRSAKHADQWGATLKAYAYPVFGGKGVAVITTEDVLKALKPIWAKKPETASRVRGRIESVIDYAKARGWRTEENPARWRGHLDHILPRRSKVAPVEHHPAYPWRQINELMASAAKSRGTAAMALRFLILTAGRSGEVRGARWSEIDLDAKTWTIPGERMKAAKEHRVPLADDAVRILEAMLPLRKAPTDLVFPGGRPGKPLSDVALTKALKGAGGDGYRVHGLRSTFRDWAAESTSYAREVAEAALAHAVGNKVEAAYRRGDLFEKRGRLMADWATFCGRPVRSGNVASIRDAQARSA